LHWQPCSVASQSQSPLHAQLAGAAMGEDCVITELQKQGWQVQI
jgi:hypothetical protein